MSDDEEWDQEEYMESAMHFRTVLFMYPTVYDVMVRGFYWFERLYWTERGKFNHEVLKQNARELLREAAWKEEWIDHALRLIDEERHRTPPAETWEDIEDWQEQQMQEAEERIEEMLEGEMEEDE